MTLSSLDVDTLTLSLGVAFVLGYLMNGIKNYWLASFKTKRELGKINSEDLKIMSQLLPSTKTIKHHKSHFINSSTTQSFMKDSDQKHSQTKPMNKSCSGKPKEQRFKRYSKSSNPKASSATEKPSAISSGGLSPDGK